MGNAAEKFNQPRPAKDSIAYCHELFGCKSSLGLSYDNLAEDVKRTLCFSAGLKQRHVDMKLHEMTDLERVELHRSINTLADALKPFAHKAFRDFQ